MSKVFTTHRAPNCTTKTYIFPSTINHPLCHNVLWCLKACTRLSIVVRNYAPRLLCVYNSTTTTTAIRLLIGLQSNSPRASVLSAQFQNRRRNARRIRTYGLPHCLPMVLQLCMQHAFLCHCRNCKSNSATQARHQFDSQIYLLRATILFLRWRPLRSLLPLFLIELNFPLRLSTVVVQVAQCAVAVVAIFVDFSILSTPSFA